MAGCVSGTDSAKTYETPFPDDPEPLRVDTVQFTVHNEAVEDVPVEAELSVPGDRLGSYWVTIPSGDSHTFSIPTTAAEDARFTVNVSRPEEPHIAASFSATRNPECVVYAEATWDGSRWSIGEVDRRCREA